MISTMTSKGQITLPEKIRRELNINPGDKIDFSAEGTFRVLHKTVKVHSVRKLKGMGNKPSKPVSIEEMERAIEEEGGRL